MRARTVAVILAALALLVGISTPASAAPVIDARVASYDTSVATTFGQTPTNVGRCSGSHKTVSWTTKAKNTYGITLTSITISTTWYYNGKVVTCAFSSRSASVSTYGGLGGWDWKGWQDKTEAWYNYNGRYHGGVKTEVAGYFKLCYNLTAKTLCPQTTYSRARTYVHYNGTYTRSGGNSS